MLEAAAAVLYLAGSAIIAIGAVGLTRLPDVFSRLAGVGLAGTAGVGCLLLGRILESPQLETVMEAGLAMILLIVTSPVAAHVIAQGGYRAGYRPRRPTDGRPVESEGEGD